MSQQRATKIVALPTGADQPSGRGDPLKASDRVNVHLDPRNVPPPLPPGFATKAGGSSAAGQSAVAGPVRLPVGAAGSVPRPEVNGVLQLLRLEGLTREVKSLDELQLVIANETRQLIRAQQIFVVSKKHDATFAVTAATGIPSVDRSAPLVQWLERTVVRLNSDVGLTEIHEFQVHAYADADDDTARAYPLRDALWLPVIGRAGGIMGGVLMLRAEPWLENDQVLAKRLSVTFAHAWSWVTSRRPTASRIVINKRVAALSTALAVMVCALPVSLTALAPLEIAGRDQVLVTAPIDGVIDDILVPSNSAVVVGQPIVRLADTQLRNRAAVAEREMQVADARVKKTMLLAFGDVRGRHELGIARAELAVKTAERNFAHELLSRTVILAPQAGIAVFGDKRDLNGRPVATGERIMEIADPNMLEVRIDVPVGDAIILKPGARVKTFLDSDPLHPLEAVVLRADYQAKTRETGVLAFRVIAQFDAAAAAQLPRLGIRGTAQLYGADVPLGFALFRRPIAALRQWTGF
jgi:multidrug efflux pump subunit AcrA (membrane-fusion protein)